MVPTGTREKDNLWFLLSHFLVLGQAKRHLFKKLQTILTTNCCLSVVNMLTCSYYTIEFMASPYWSGTWQDLSDVLEYTFRLWLICHIADQIRSSVCLFIYVFVIRFIFGYKAESNTTGGNPINVYSINRQKIVFQSCVGCEHRCYPKLNGIKYQPIQSTYPIKVIFEK